MTKKETIKRVSEHVKELNLYRSMTEIIAMYGGKTWTINLCKGQLDMNIDILIGISENGEDTIIVSPSEKIYKAVGDKLPILFHIGDDR